MGLESKGGQPQAKASDLYIEGLKAIQEKHGVSLDRAHEIAQQDLRNVSADEHVQPTRAAYEHLKGQQSQGKTGSKQ